MTTALSEVNRIKRQIYTKVAELTWLDQLAEKINDLPDEIIGQNKLNYRCCEHKERAILRERIRLSLGLNPRQVSKHASLKDMARRSQTQKEWKQDCIIEMMAVACDRCPIDKFVVTDACRNCCAHYCQNSCPKGAITIVHGRAYIDRGKCIECGRCATSCSYHAIVQITRPCEQACAVKAVKPDSDGTAQIDCDLCVGCGACINACPFGSVGDYAQIVPLVEALKQKTRPVFALIAPAFVGQFGPKASASAVKSGLLQLGFTDVVEVAKGAEKVAQAEAAEYLERKAAGEKVMTTSCCPAFVGMIQKHYPEQAGIISHTPSPMVELAKQLKEQHPEALTVFIGPCLAKKSEAAKEPAVDIVVTFEEVLAVLVSRNINLANIEPSADLSDAGPLGRGFARSGGVTEALVASLPEGSIPPIVYRANGLSEAISACEEIKKGDFPADFIEGMACKGGCIAGPGTLLNPAVAEKLLERFCAPTKKLQKVGN